MPLSLLLATEISTVAVAVPTFHRLGQRWFRLWLESSCGGCPLPLFRFGSSLSTAVLVNDPLQWMEGGGSHSGTVSTLLQPSCRGEMQAGAVLRAEQLVVRILTLDFDVAGMIMHLYHPVMPRKSVALPGASLAALASALTYCFSAGVFWVRD